jgi:hypothetical protein
MRARNSIAAVILLCGALALASTAQAGEDTYNMKEIVNEAGGVFGGVSEAIAKVIESAFKAHGEPTGFIKGSDRGGAVAVGYRQGEGTLTLKNRGSHKVYWRSPSVGFEVGGSTTKAFILVYKLRDPEKIYRKFPGVEGNAYVFGGAGVTYNQWSDVVLATVRTGVGRRVGGNVGVLTFTRKKTKLPFKK